MQLAGTYRSAVRSLQTRMCQAGYLNIVLKPSVPHIPKIRPLGDNQSLDSLLTDEGSDFGGNARSAFQHSNRRIAGSDAETDSRGGR